MYRERITQNRLPCEISQHDHSLDYSRPIIIRLAYHGHIDKRRVVWDRVHPEVIGKLELLKQEGFVVESQNSMALTKLGWYWYVNLMYFLMPKADQLLMNSVVVDKLKDPGRKFSRRELLYPIAPHGVA